MSTGSGAGSARSDWVKIPLMPTGVEHTYKQVVEILGKEVKIPLMPTGVEHAVEYERLIAIFEGENSIDANRR